MMENPTKGTSYALSLVLLTTIILGPWQSPCLARLDVFVDYANTQVKKDIVVIVPMITTSQVFSTKAYPHHPKQTCENRKRQILQKTTDWQLHSQGHNK